MSKSTMEFDYFYTLKAFLKQYSAAMATASELREEVARLGPGA